MNEFEKNVLSACLINPSYFSVVLDILRSDHFTSPGRAIYLAMRSLLEKGHEVEIVGVKHELSKAGNLEEAGGAAALGDLIVGFPQISKNILLGWCSHVKEAGRRRRIASEAVRVAALTTDDSLDSASLLSQIQAVAFNLDTGTVGGTNYGPVQLRVEATRLVDQIADSANGIVGVPSGIEALDAMTGGFRSGQYIAIGSRPSVGKSSLSLQIANNAANLGHTVVFFSLEMEAADLALIRACAEAQISRHLIQVTRGNNQHMPRLFAALERQCQTPFYVEKLSSPSLGPIRARAARIKAEHGLGMIVVDYIQLCRSESKRSNRNEELTEISSGLKSMAMAMGVPVIVCAQLNREAVGKENEQPKLSHFRDSGSIEADADVAILLHRINAAQDRSLPVDVDLIVEKNRVGSCGKVNTSFVGKYQTFVPREEIQ